jgi:hypothetical protein
MALLWAEASVANAMKVKGERRVGQTVLSDLYHKGSVSGKMGRQQCPAGLCLSFPPWSLHAYSIGTTGTINHGNREQRGGQMEVQITQA